MNAHLRSIFQREGEPKDDMGGGGAVPGSGDDVGGEGPTVVSALGTGIQIPGCVGCVRYGAPMSPGLVGLIEVCQRVWARGQEGLAQPAAQGLCAGSRCQQWHLGGKVASVAGSVFRWLSGFVLVCDLNSSCRLQTWSWDEEHSPTRMLWFCRGTENPWALLCSQLGSQPTGCMAKMVPCT